MSTAKNTDLRQKLLFFATFVLVVSSGISLLKQLTIYPRLDQRLVQKKEELAGLKQKNQALKVKLKEVENPEFLDEQRKKLLGKGKMPQAEAAIFVSEKNWKMPNYQKWLGLFVY